MKKELVKREGDILTLDSYVERRKASYPRKLIEFLGGINTFSNFNMAGHRIIYCTMSILKSLQAFKKKHIEWGDEDELTYDVETQTLMTTREIYERQLKQESMTSGTVITHERVKSIDFSMLEVIIPTKALNDNGRIKVKSNMVYIDQLKFLSKIGEHEVESNNGKEVAIFKFVEFPVYEKGMSYIKFFISKKTAEILLNNTEGYIDVVRNLIFKTNSTMPFNIITYLKSKAMGRMEGRFKIEDLINSLNLSTRNLHSSRLKEFLTHQRIILDKVNDESFNFKIENDRVNFVLYNTNNSIVINNTTDEKYRGDNALKNIKKTRKISPEQYDVIKQRFEEIGYYKIQEITKKKLSREIVGDEYFKWFIDQCMMYGFFLRND